MKMDDCEERLSQIRECILYKDPIGVKKLILEDKFKDESKFWELISVLGECVCRENFNTAPGFLEVCERCLRYIINVGNPKELLLACLEQADTFEDSVKFQTFVGLIKTCILKLPCKQLFSLEVALETLSDCITKLEVPEGLDTDEENNAMELHPEIEKANQFLTAYLDFLTPFAEQVEYTKPTDNREDTLKQREFLAKYLLKVLEHPLVLLDLSMKEGISGLTVKPDARVSAERAVILLLKVNKTVYTIIDTCLKHNEQVQQKLRMKSQDFAADLEQVSNLSLSCLEYLSLVENVAELGHPCLVSKLCLLQISLPLLLSLISRPESEPKKKGVALFQALLPHKLDVKILSHEELGHPEYFKILGSLFQIMIHCPMKTLRQECVQLVPRFIQLFEDIGRYQMFVKLFGTLNHPGAVGYCIQLLKAQLDEILSDQWTGSKSAHVFTGLNLKRLFLLVTSLPEGAATDLVENSDRIISVLNLIRYLVLKDLPKENMTGVWDFIQEIERDFLEEVQTGLDMSKGHYQMEVAGLEEGNKTKAANEEDVEMSVTVAGFKLPRMARGQKIAIMKQAINTLDLITSLLVRVNELIEQQSKLK